MALEGLAERHPVELVATPTFAMQPRIVQLSPDRRLSLGLRVVQEDQALLPQPQAVPHPADIRRLGPGTLAVRLDQLLVLTLMGEQVEAARQGQTVLEELEELARVALTEEAVVEETEMAVTAALQAEHLQLVMAVLVVRTI